MTKSEDPVGAEGFPTESEKKARQTFFAKWLAASPAELVK